MNSGKKPCALANVVAWVGLSITDIRSQSAWVYLLFTQTPRSEPPEKAGAGAGPFSLGMGNEAQSAAYFLLTAVSSDCAQGPSTYMSSLPRAKSSLAPPEVAPGAPSSVWPTYFDGDRCWLKYRSA